MTMMLGSLVFEYAGAVESTHPVDPFFIAVRGEGFDDPSNPI